MTRHPDRSRTSMRELIAEAERREIAGAEWMDRAALLRSLEEGDGSSALGTLARARRFFGQVTGLDKVVKVVRGAIDPSRPESPSLVVERTTPSEPPVPAAAVAREIVSAESARTEPSVSDVVAAPPPSEVRDVGEAVVPAAVQQATRLDASGHTLVPRADDLLGSDPSFGGLRVVSRDGRAWLVWRAPSSRLAAIGRGDELTLRVVSIGCEIGEPDASVVVETADESGLAREGVRALPDVRGRPCVAAIGVGRGAEFVAVAHARVA